MGFAAAVAARAAIQALKSPDQWVQWEAEETVRREKDCRKEDEERAECRKLEQQARIRRVAFSGVLAVAFVVACYALVQLTNRSDDEANQRCIAAHFSREQCAVLAEARANDHLVAGLAGAAIGMAATRG